MKTLIGLAAALTVSVPAAALAQSPIYGSLGYANDHVANADAGAVQARLGARFIPYLGAEVELSKAASLPSTTRWRRRPVTASATIA